MKVTADKVIYSFSPDMEPTIEVEPGTIIEFETLDCFANQITDSRQSLDKVDWEQINPATGPVFVRGAEKGDSLKVSILSVEVGNQGVMAAIPGGGVMGEKVTRSEIKLIPIRKGMAYFDDLLLPIKPMIGVIGVAPSSETVPCGTPGRHGGNLDTNLVCAGNDIILPVGVSGALLALGDVHARMGDGEVWVTGIEIPAKVTVKVEVLKKKAFPEPVIINNEIVAFLSSALSLDDAVQKATEHAVECLVQLGLSQNEAGMLLSAVGDLQISQVVDPLKTARMVIPRWILAKYGFDVR